MNPKVASNQFTPRKGPHEYSIEHFEDKFYISLTGKLTNFKLMQTSQETTDLEGGPH